MVQHKTTAARSTRGVVVKDVPGDSPFWAAGLRAGDRIVSVNGEEVGDELEFEFLAADEVLELEVIRRGRRRVVEVWREPGRFLDIEFQARPIRRCGNRCIFCFVDQLPRGLRKSLYIKDEDYRHSFTAGNYITLTTTTERDMERIERFGLSPLYISVHATDPTVRRLLLGTRRDAAILPKLQRLAERNIRYHTQIVVCPGINDGAVLDRTIAELLAIGEACLSVAVVPVGLTCHRSRPLAPVTAESAKVVCAQVADWSDRDLRQCETRRVFAADELLIRAGLPIPPRSFYEDYPQIENGVGLVRLMLEEWRRERLRLRNAGDTRRSVAKPRLLVLTSMSAQPYVSKVAQGIERALPGSALTVTAVRNRFLGESVTVAGLLSAADMIRAAVSTDRSWDLLVLPGVCFNHRGHTLDGYSLKRIGQCVGKPVAAAETIAELVGVAGGQGGGA